MKRFCEDCRTYGHTKFLWGGTHYTHRLYLRYKMWRAVRKVKRGKGLQEDL